MSGCSIIGRLFGACLEIVSPEWQATETGYKWLVPVDSSQEVCVCQPYDRGCHSKEGFVEVIFKGRRDSIWLARLHPENSRKSIYGKSYCLTKTAGEMLEFRLTKLQDGHLWLTLW